MKTFNEVLNESKNTPKEYIDIFGKIDVTKNNSKNINVYGDIINGFKYQVTVDEEYALDDKSFTFFKILKDYDFKIGDEVAFVTVDIYFDIAFITKEVDQKYDVIYNKRTKKALYTIAHKSFKALI